MKKLLAVLITLFVAALSALLVYNFIIVPYQQDMNRAAPDPSQLDQDNQEKQDDQNDQVNQDKNYLNKVFAISDREVIGATISEDKSHVIYYQKDTGFVKQARLDGSGLEVISSFEIDGLNSVIWSSDKSKVVCSKINNSGKEQYVYDYSVSKAFPLSSGFRNIVFSNNGQRIAYNYVNSANQTSSISVADADGENWKTVLDVRINNPIIQWVDSYKLAVYEHPSFESSSSILIIDIGDAHLDRILAGSRGLSAKFSPDGDKLLYNSSDSDGGDFQIAFFDRKSKQKTEVELKTFIEKCVWSKNNKDVYCAVLERLPSGDLPDVFYEKTTTTKDYFVKINAETGVETVIIPKITSLNVDAREMFLSTTEDYLYFVNYVDGRLYGIDL